MDKENNGSANKFWHLFILVAVGLALTGAVYFYARGNILQDEVNSLQVP